jgi:hypothetical protein
VSEARISHEDLERFAQGLAELRDKRLADAEKYPSLAERLKGEAEGYGFALGSLHNWSDGAYGQSWNEQDAEAGK